MPTPLMIELLPLVLFLPGIFHGSASAPNRSRFRRNRLFPLEFWLVQAHLLECLFSSV
jgi:hypothetical protein